MSWEYIKSFTENNNSALWASLGVDLVKTAVFNTFILFDPDFKTTAEVTPATAAVWGCGRAGTRMADHNTADREQEPKLIQK